LFQPRSRATPGVAGWAGSRPVRVANAAADQLQRDVLGLVVEAVSVYVQTGGRLEDETWDLVKTIADHVGDAADEPSNGIWEAGSLPAWSAPTWGAGSHSTGRSGSLGGGGRSPAAGGGGRLAANSANGCSQRSAPTAGSPRRTTAKGRTATRRRS
jgi:hypothetical protein